MRKYKNDKWVYWGRWVLGMSFGGGGWVWGRGGNTKPLYL